MIVYKRDRVERQARQECHISGLEEIIPYISVEISDH